MITFFFATSILFEIQVIDKLGAYRPVIRYINQVVGIIAFQLQFARLISLLLATIQNAIRPWWITLHPILWIVILLSFKGGSEFHFAFLEEFRDVAKLPFYLELVVIEEYIEIVEWHGLNDRLFKTIDSIIQIAKEHQQVWLHSDWHNVILIAAACAPNELGKDLGYVSVTLLDRVLSWVQVHVDKYHFSVCQVKLEFDASFVAHHVAETCSDDVWLDLCDQWKKSYSCEDDEMRGLKWYRSNHTELITQALLDKSIHQSFRRLENGADDRTECLLRAHNIDVVMSLISEQEVSDVLLRWFLASDIPSDDEDS